MNLDPSFGHFVRQRRRKLDLTQEELARRVGCAAITIRKIEADDARASVQIAERLAMALAIPLDERAGFVRRARAARPEVVLSAETPAPALEEIGNADLTGRAIRGYALAEKIGVGGMGAVYRAIQPVVEREVAIKIILPAFANNPDFIRRFEAEAQLVARLEHPHIVPLYDYWREPGVAYLVMRMLRGGSVQGLLENGPLPIETVARFLEQICDALHSAHRIGIIHRDLKPGNVLLDEDENAYLADFGIAKNLGSPDLESQTNVDAMVGSPQYMSPEQIRSLSVRPQTDIYCLGVMLYEMLSGTLPFIGPTPFDLLQQHVNAPLPSLAARRNGLPAALDMVISRAAAKDPDDRYPNALALLEGFHQALDGALTHPIFIPTVEEESSVELINPYKGLRAFGEADSDDFFGRETLIQQLLARLGEGGELTRFLAVVGPSGSGKSSVVKAGLMPALRRGGLPGSENWFLADLIPGPHPFEALEAALLRVAVNPPASLLAQLKENERGLLRAVNRILPADPSIELVLVIDQFEEVFTLLADETERALLLNSLVNAALDERSRVRIVITLRADFIDRPLRYVDFGELIQRRGELVLPLTPDEVERAILGPAQRAGLRLEPGLILAMTHDVGDQPGGLPLLQYALTELFEKCISGNAHHNLLTKAAYIEIGGVLGALGRRAEEVYASLDQAGQSAARQLFLRLVTLGEGVEDTRRRVLRAEFESLMVNRRPKTEDEARLSTVHGLPSTVFALSSIIDAFAKHRLLSLDRDPVTRGATVEVAHEALIRVWGRLREWLNDSRADLRMQRQLALAAAEWMQAKQDASFLLTGAHLEQFEGWIADAQIALTQDEQAYLSASMAERTSRHAEETERQRRELEAAQKLAETEHQSLIRLRLRNRAITTVGVAAIMLALLAGLFGLQSYQNQQRAEVASTEAVNQAHVAATAKANADAQANIARGRELALESQSLSFDINTGSIVSGLLAVESAHYGVGVQADQALRHYLTFGISPLVVGHYEGGFVSAVAFSTDGKYIVSGHADKTVRIETATGLEVLRMNHDDVVTSVTFSPDGKYVLSGSKDKTIRLWDRNTGHEVLRITQPGFVRSVAFSVDGKYIVSGCDDKTVSVWDIQDGHQVAQMNHDGIVYSVAFSPDGKYIVSGSNDKTVRIWDVRTWQEVTRMRHDGIVYSVAFSPNGKSIVSGSADKTVRIWETSTGQGLTRIMHEDIVNAVAFSPDGKYVITATNSSPGSFMHTSRNDKTVQVWEAQTGQKVAFIRYGGNVYSAAFSPNGKSIVWGGATHTVEVWNIQTSDVARFAHNGDVRRIAFSPDGKYLLSGSLDHTARVWDLQSGDEIARMNHGDYVWSVAYSPDGKYVVSAGFDKTARVWEAQTGREVARMIHSDNVITVVFSPSGKYVASTSADGIAMVWDALTGREITRMTTPSAIVRPVVFSPDEKYVASGSDDNTVRVWEAQTGREVSLMRHTKLVWSVVFSPDGKYVVSSSDDKTARVWEAQTGHEVARMTHNDWVGYAAFSPDGKYIVSASGDKTARVWDAQTGREVARMTHDDIVGPVAFSPDGQYIVSGSDDKTVRVWETQSGREVARVTTNGLVEYVAFSPDGKYVASSSSDGIARVWYWRLGDLVAEVCRRLPRNFTHAEWAQYFPSEDYRATCPNLHLEP